MDRIVRATCWFGTAVALALAAITTARSQQLLPPAPLSAVPASSVYRIATPTPPAEQVIVLLDGGVLTGQVLRDNDRYVITRPAGKVFIPVPRVMLVANSLGEAYQKRRERILSPTADSHLDLADWCLKQNMLAEAEVELSAAQKLDALHQRLPSLQQRYILQRDRPKRTAPVASVPTKSAPRGGGDILQVAAVETPADLRHLPPGTIEMFTRKVQPVLVNNCATSGCHAVGGNSAFQLDRAILHGMSNKRSTMNNLTATLALVDQKNPRESPLLTVPRQAHGGKKHPAFGPRQEAAFHHVYDWVMQVTNCDDGQPAVVPNAVQQAVLNVPIGLPGSSVSPSPATPAPANPSFAPLSAEADLEPGSLQEPSEFMDPSAGYNAAAQPQPMQLKRQWEPRDEFDPEIFNRAYAPANSTQAPLSRTRSRLPRNAIPADGAGSLPDIEAGEMPAESAP